MDKWQLLLGLPRLATIAAGQWSPQTKEWLLRHNNVWACVDELA
jgi:hypothetical protein